ncbi:MAG: hypothetical protein JWN43_1385 [Gammaproteobacteria bacterium]|nr:hypothetical protein [Gammaproteobacteria bacterium]
MKPRKLWIIVTAVAFACGGIEVAIWHRQEARQPFNVENHVRRSFAIVEHRPEPSTAATIAPLPAAQTDTQGLRRRFREATDYAQLVKELGSLALDGNPEAQYVTAQALRWCDQTLRLYFIRPNGQSRTLDEVQARRATHSAGISPQELTAIFTRCQGFLEEPDLLRTTPTWDQWLDRAVSAKYPAAMAEKARQAEAAIALASVSQQPHSPPDPGAEDQAKDLALLAVQSGDPDAIFLMSDWVRGANRTPDESETLASAWKILACQKGYDCGPKSDFIRAVCDWDAQCADGQSYVDYFQRQLGTQYDDALALAKTIDEKIAAKDIQALRSYL